MVMLKSLTFTCFVALSILVPLYYCNRSITCTNFKRIVKNYFNSFFERIISLVQGVPGSDGFSSGGFATDGFLFGFSPLFPRHNFHKPRFLSGTKLTLYIKWNILSVFNIFCLCYSHVWHLSSSLSAEK